ncbi:hypothetical protein BHS04_08345 [Myxococcus xanthus]|nr:hypothetical protein BHS04_08345 [Myxococcus xanthus]
MWPTTRPWLASWRRPGRRGLVRALIHEGLGRMHMMGARQAIVYAFADNPVPLALYQSAGFTVVDRNLGHTLASP